MAVESTAGIRAKNVTDMVEFMIRTNKARGKSVKLEDVVSATFINIISNVLVSKNVFGDGAEGESDGRVTRFINKLVEGGTTFGVTDVFPVLKWVDFWSKGLTTFIFREISFIWGEIVKERRMGYHDDANYDNSTKDFLDVLNEHGLSDDQIAILLTELLIGGTTSTTTTTMWLMTELMKYQECLDKLRKEIANKAVDEGGNTLNESLLSQCQYLQACIKETLRLHVPSPLGVPHRAIETCKVNNGYTIPKDSIVMVNVWAIQMDPNNWEDASSFKPERFLSGMDFKGINFKYIPFGAGQIMCPGANVAFKGVQLVVPSLVHYFDWSLPNGKDLGVLDTSDRFRTTFLKDKPLYMIPKPRNNYIVG
ncbi:hypothetical protein DH2020_010008 [Rehmannia glutinosa]|uniref:Cytochrome P450 protein n=1 Tax=Rehmannia glutinosa TaxID=99300 RepID=A0ABR0XA52_REHGL